MEPRPAVLVIAGSDSSGGAGLVRDVRTLTDFGADALCVVTAVTAQSNRRVTAVHPIPPAVIRAQIEAALETCTPSAIKVGMLADRATVEAVATALEALAGAADTLGSIAAAHSRGHAPIVLDPVLVSSSGGVLLDGGGRRALAERLLPLVTVLTPNIPEAAMLLGEPLGESPAELDALAHRLLGLGPAAILLKGGHAAEREAIDRLLVRDWPMERLVSPRIGAGLRGTGCALACGIAAELARGLPLADACRRAKSYVHGRLREALAD
jgi:hydroxymethylpyrimidine/phosphomethylpyrimidine kinase